MTGAWWRRLWRLFEWEIEWENGTRAHGNALGLIVMFAVLALALGGAIRLWEWAL